MRLMRRTYITHTGLQFKFCFLFVLISLAGTAVAVAVFNYFALKELDALRWSTHIGVETTGEIISQLLLKTGAADILFVSVMLIFAGIFMLRKTSGPIYRLMKGVLNLGDGDLSTHIVLRKKDEFQDTAHELDNMRKKLRDKFITINDQYTNVSRAIDILDVINRDKEKCITYCNSILEHIEAIEAELNSFSCNDTASVTG